jgi:hypothetical protein
LVNHPFPINGLPLASQEQEKFAIFKFSGKQYKVTQVLFQPYSIIVLCGYFVFTSLSTQDDVIVADKLKNADIGSMIKIDEVSYISNYSMLVFFRHSSSVLFQVLLVGSRKATLVGRPTVQGAQVDEVEFFANIISYRFTMHY